MLLDLETTLTAARAALGVTVGHSDEQRVSQTDIVTLPPNFGFQLLRVFDELRQFGPRWLGGVLDLFKLLKVREIE
jgi:hypothetical protein